MAKKDTDDTLVVVHNNSGWVPRKESEPRSKKPETTSEQSEKGKA